MKIPPEVSETKIINCSSWDEALKLIQKMKIDDWNWYDTNLITQKCSFYRV